MLVVGCSTPILNHNCEVKPYTIDAFLAVAVATLFCSTKHWRPGRRLVLFAGLAPLVIFLSYPGCFVYGGLLIALLPGLWDCRRQWQAWLGYTALVAVTFTAFFLLLIGPIRAQQTAALAGHWTDYPEWHEPWLVPLWSVGVSIRLWEHLWRPTGGAPIVAVVLGAIGLWRRKQREEAAILALPAILALLAAWLRVYPLESRLVLYAAAPLALLAGEGIVEITAWLRSNPFFRRSRAGSVARVASFAVLYIVLLMPLGNTFYYLVAPLPRMTQEPWPEGLRAGHDAITEERSCQPACENTRALSLRKSAAGR